MLKRYLNKKGSWVILILILALGLVVRLKDFNVLPIDAHPMRQTDTECVAYFIAISKSNFLNPKACLMRPVSNNEGYFFLEMPFYELAIAGSYKIFGFYPFAARLINLILYILGSLGLFGFMSKWWNKKIALLSVFIFSFIPGSIFFVGHAIHPDAMAVSFIMVALYFGWKYRENGKFINLILSGLFLGISVASRPFGLICLPMLGYFLYLRKSKVKDYLIILFLSIGFYGFWWWRTKSIGIDMGWENWVLGGREKLLDLAILKNLIWKNVIGETMGKIVSGLAGLGLIIGLVKKDKRIIPLSLWIGGVIVYWLVVPNGNITHQYYADVYIPLFVILAAIGLEWIWNKNKILALLILPILIYNGVRTSNYHYGNQAGGEMEIKIAEDIKKAIPEDKKIIYLAVADSVPLSLSHRQGWMLGEWPIDVAVHIWSFMEMRHYGFDYIVEPKNRMDINTEELNIIKQNYPLVEELETIRIYKYR
ncbi:MAG: glycosyltransferase family 39 protein [Candidatus Shapirobacteria bacterium]|nr:glycosyltransferase family 39 protein [Candidatus Shapirobacteria bacterium]